MDIKAKIEEIVEKVKKNPAMLKKFQTEPVKVVEELIGMDRRMRSRGCGI